MSATKLEPLDGKYKQSSYARMGNRMAAYRKFIATPTKVNMMTTLQDCLHDIYAKRPADPLLALSLRLQNKIATRNRQENKNKAVLNEVARLSDENHRLRLLLGPQGMDLAESMERMQFTASENRATIEGLEKTRDGLKEEIVSLNQQLANMQKIIDEKDCLISQYARSLSKLYGAEETEAVIKIQALSRGVTRRQSMGQTKAAVYDEDDADDESSSSDESESDDDHHFDGDFEKMDSHLSVNPRHHHGVKKRRKLVVKKRAVQNYASDSQLGNDEFADLDREINAMLSDDDHELMDQLDDKLKEILDDVDIDDAITAATKIQALHRGGAARAGKQDDDDEEGVAALNEYLGTLSEADVEKAVCKIQALSRGRRVRTRMDAPQMHAGPIISPDVEALHEFLQDADEGKIRRSASKIQAVHRGNRARREVHHKRKQEKAAVDIQRVYRGRHARTAVRQRRRGRLSVQKANSSVPEAADIVLGPDDE